MLLILQISKWTDGWMDITNNTEVSQWELAELFMYKVVT